MQTRALQGLLLLSLGWAIACPAASFSIHNNEADTLSANEVLKSRNVSVISRMTDDQLVTLINLLFEMDSIPADLIAEIGKTVRDRKKATEPGKQAGVIVPVTLGFYTSSKPVSEFYSEFDTKKILPVEDMWKKSDTSYIIDLFPGEHTAFFMPTCPIVSSPFGWRDSAMHNGIDLDLNKGDPVNCAFDGVVRFAGRQGNYGNVVLVRHYNGLETIYAHLHKIRVKPGQMVVAGQALGLGGSTGRSTGSHLHFETRFKGTPINPKYFISFAQEKALGGKMIIRKTRNGMCAYPIDAKLYTVEKGDNLWEIAKRYGTSIKSIKALNDMSGKNFRIRPGMKIRVG